MTRGHAAYRDNPSEGQRESQKPAASLRIASARAGSFTAAGHPFVAGGVLRHEHEGWLNRLSAIDQRSDGWRELA
jgi:hypothetical protein